ncbi:MAG: hypothetical protein JW732_08280 [Dehalococcoidia bacterium]|nr:hypothetical protein [Dehalococcoidia bacterium]
MAKMIVAFFHITTDALLAMRVMSAMPKRRGAYREPGGQACLHKGIKEG